jgi:hypothetical protein
MKKHPLPWKSGNDPPRRKIKSFTFGDWNGELSKRAVSYQDLAQAAAVNPQISSNALLDIWAKYVAAAGAMSVTA